MGANLVMEETVEAAAPDGGDRARDDAQIRSTSLAHLVFTFSVTRRAWRELRPSSVEPEDRGLGVESGLCGDAVAAEARRVDALAAGVEVGRRRGGETFRMRDGCELFLFRRDRCERFAIDRSFFFFRATKCDERQSKRSPGNGTPSHFFR